jgi:pyruvate/2-oxoglutarate dehydrogenase complex dihydrolipoamide acyltransferase (E2) component
MTKDINTPWRQIAAAIYEKPVDGKISGIQDFKMEHIAKAMKEWNADGHRVTYTHVFMSLLIRSMAEYAPELNAYCQWGKTIARDEFVISTAVSVKGQDLTTVKIRNADKKSVLDIAKETNDYVTSKRSGSADNTTKKRNVLASIPWPFRKWIFKFLRWMTYEVGIQIPASGLHRDLFGSVLVSNIGPLGMAYGIPALMPASNLSFVFTIGKVTEKAIVKDGKVVPCLMLPAAATFDHRIADGAHISKLVKGMIYYMENPHELAISKL